MGTYVFRLFAESQQAYEFLVQFPFSAPRESGVDNEDSLALQVELLTIAQMVCVSIQCVIGRRTILYG